MRGSSSGVGLKPRYASIFFLIWILITSCSEENRITGQGESGRGELQVRTAWQTTGPGTTDRQAPPSGDVCADFLITGVKIRVKSASGNVVTESDVIRCSEHHANLGSLPAQIGYKVEVEGLIGDQIQWFGEKTDVGVKAGQSSEITVGMRFTGEASTPPVATILPENSATHIPTDREIKVHFDKDVVPASVNTDTVRITKGDEPVPGSVTYNPETFEAVFQPDEELAVSTTYSVTVGAEVMDRSGQNIAQEITSQFSTTLVWFVDLESPNSGPGKSWGEAFHTIAEAVNAAFDGDQIWIKKGTYLPASQIALNKPVKLLGGFEGTEAQHHQRDIEAFETVVGGNGERRCFYIASNVTIDGFTIKGGATAGAQHTRGGAMYIDKASPVIKNCIFTNNQSQGYTIGHGGAIYIDEGSPVIEGCTFIDNTAGIDAGSGGAIYNNGGGPTISQCIFRNNSATGGESSSGGAITNDNSTATTTISQCLFDSNHTGGASSVGGAIINLNSDIMVSDCRFQNNYSWGSSGMGGAIYQSGRNANIQNCIFYANFVKGGTETSSGGAVYNRASSLSVMNCSFFKNVSEGSGSAIENNQQGNVVIANSIIWANPFTTSGQIHKDTNSSTTVSYSNVEEWPGGGVGNMRINPRFGDNQHLRSDSPCIDKGDSSVAPVTDIDGENRSKYTPVDMGADEFIDSDGDMLPDYWETLHAVSNAQNDVDDDQIPNIGEYHLGTDPNTSQQTLNVNTWGTVGDDDAHQAAGADTVVGRLAPKIWRSYFVFDIAAATQVTAAAIRLELPGYETTDIPEPIQIWSVSASTADLTSGASGIYNDLGSGDLFSDFELTPSDEGAVLDLSLDSSAAEAITTAGSGTGKFVIGLSLKSPNAGYLLLGKTDEARIGQLILIE